jgi:nitrous oxidase accessory protein NosD
MKTLTETRSKAGFASVCLVLAAAASATAADLNVPADYPTIQAAVDAASDGDIIHIAPGVYTDQVRIISQKLTLIGQPGTILRATEQLPVIPGSPAPQWSIMFTRSSEVTVRGLTFEGERLAERFVGLGNLQGILLRESSAIVENCAFYGFRESTPGTEAANALTATGFEDGEVNVRVAECTFADNYDAISFVGLPDRKSMNVRVENNTIIGTGPLDRGWNYAGITIREGVGGRIAGNTISGYSYIGTAADFDIAFGILAVYAANDQVASGILQHLEIEGNTLRDNQVHIALVKANGSIIRNNRFQGTAPGILPLGLALTGRNVTIANNQFENMPEGIRLFGDDPNYGTILGIAVNAQVTSNRFCGVTTNITVQPLASATVTGTLLCPFPPPPLAIAPAVLLSWPGEDDGWAVESATSVDGPWAASDATPFTQYGRHSIAVPTDGAHRFFRLR